jgi:electron transfer flavoprotein alpha/beta subunit
VACVLVHIEAEGDRPTAASLGALGEGRRVASRFGASLYAVVLTTAEGDDHDPGSTIRVGPVDPGALGGTPLVGELARGGADKVVFVTVEAIQQPTLWSTAGAALASACEYLRPLVVLVPTSRGGHDIAPRLAARLGAAYVPDAAIDFVGDTVVARRRVYAGSLERRWVLDDLDRVAVIGVAGGGVARGGDDAEVMLLPAAAEIDDRVQALATDAEIAPAPGAAPTIAVLVRGLLHDPDHPADVAMGASERAAVRAAVALGMDLGTQVIAIAAGAAAQHERALRVAIGAGCDRAVRIESDDAAALDYLGLAQILAQAAKKLGANLIVCGDKSTDEATGALGPAVAELLDAAHLTDVDGLAARERAVIASRPPLQFRITPPAILAIRSGDVDTTQPIAAPDAAATIAVMSLADIGLDPRVLAHRKETSGEVTGGVDDAAVTHPGPDIGEVHIGTVKPDDEGAS